MTDNIIWHTDFRARRQREAAELEMEVASEALTGDQIAYLHELAEDRRRIWKSDTSPSEMNPQDSA